MDNIALFSLITIMSFFILLPFALLTEGLTFTPEAMKGMVGNASLGTLLDIADHFLYNLCSPCHPFS